MTEKPATPPPPSATLTNWAWSAITPGDLGLKAAYWSLNQTEPVEFRPIVGWITVTADEVYSDGRQRRWNSFLPVVLGPDMFPTLAGGMENYRIVCTKSMTDSEVKELILRWQKDAKKKQAPPTPNISGTGLA